MGQHPLLPFRQLPGPGVIVGREGVALGRDRLVHVRHFTHEIRKRDLAEGGKSLAVLNFRKPQDSGDGR